MNKTLSLACILVTCALLTVTGQTVADDSFATMSGWTPVYGTWSANGALVQSDTKTGLAMINRKLPQSGSYQLEYTATYLAGGYANAAAAAMGKYHGGFGIHIGIDKPATSVSWGNGESYLLWFNLDTEVPESSPYYGLRAQVYKSSSNSVMNLMDDYNAEILPQDVVEANLDYLSVPLTVTMIVDTESGEVQVFDPTQEDTYYSVYLDPAILKGSYVSFRTNTLSMSFDDFRITKLR